MYAILYHVFSNNVEIFVVKIISRSLPLSSHTITDEHINYDIHYVQYYA